MNVENIKKFGIKISMDDFGKGYSSLAMLLNFHVDKLKIDKEFIQHIGNEREEKIIIAVIKMAKALGLKVVAEGIETTEQARFLKNINCEQGQGYLWSKPLPSDDIKKHLN